MILRNIQKLADLLDRNGLWRQADYLDAFIASGSEKDDIGTLKWMMSQKFNTDDDTTVDIHLPYEIAYRHQIESDKQDLLYDVGNQLSHSIGGQLIDKSIASDAHVIVVKGPLQIKLYIHDPEHGKINPTLICIMRTDVAQKQLFFPIPFNKGAVGAEFVNSVVQKIIEVIK